MARLRAVQPDRLRVVDRDGENRLSDTADRDRHEAGEDGGLVEWHTGGAEGGLRDRMIVGVVVEVHLVAGHRAEDGGVEDECAVADGDVVSCAVHHLSLTGSGNGEQEEGSEAEGNKAEAEHGCWIVGGRGEG